MASSPEKKRRVWLYVGLVFLVLGAAVLGIFLRTNRQLAAAREALARGDPEQAQQRLGRCWAVGPSRHEVHFLAAQTARRLDDAKEAERHLRVCEARDGITPASALERTLLGVQRGDFSSMESDLLTLAKKEGP